MADHAPLIWDAVLEGTDASRRWRARVDALIRQPTGGYLPLVVGGRRVARPDPRRRVQVLPIARLGAGTPEERPGRARTAAGESYRLALVARELTRRTGRRCTHGAVVGQEPSHCYIFPLARLEEGLEAALRAPEPAVPRRVKECGRCVFEGLCHAELLAADDVSLVIPGDRADALRARGIHTVSGLAAAGLGEASHLARAWQEGIPLLRRLPFPDVPVRRADVEIDLDVEAYLDRCAFLWGLYDGRRYRAFSTWCGPEDAAAEAHAFAAMWQWLAARREQAQREHRGFAVYCYSSTGENHWLRRCAERFGGREWPGPYGVVRAPERGEVDRFIASAHWVDVFSAVKQTLVGTGGVGLKVVARAAGFRWREADLDGRQAAALYPAAQRDAGLRSRLLSYNEDDCRATARVRSWLDRGAPGIPWLGQQAELAAAAHSSRA